MVFHGVTDEAVACARSAAECMNIPFHRFDFADAFHHAVIQNFIDEYSQGRTPNPCILCNEYIKFGAFMTMAEKLGFSKIATGHYATIDENKGRFLLKRGRDKNEQSYFLYRLRQRQLAQTVLPMGQYTKQEVRDMAHRFGLPTARRTKSQDVCFVPDNNYISFLEDYVPQRPGPILDKDGNVVGEHKGIIAYTCGQRRGIGLSRAEPYYVTRIDAERNAIYVGDREDVYRRRLRARAVHFVLFDTLTERIEVQAKPRYVASLAEASVDPLPGNTVEVIFAEPQLAPTPGQSVVFYQGDVLVGGGIIEEVF